MNVSGLYVGRHWHLPTGRGYHMRPRPRAALALSVLGSRFAWQRAQASKMDGYSSGTLQTARPMTGGGLTTNPMRNSPHGRCAPPTQLP